MKGVLPVKTPDIFKKHVSKSGFFLMIISLFCCGILPLKAYAKSIYLPTKITDYYYNNPKAGTESKTTVTCTITCKRNKYGMVTSRKEKFGNKVKKETYKYTFKKGLLKKTSNDQYKQTFKYNKKKKLTTKSTYSLRGKLKNKIKYVYKGSKLVKEKFYEPNKLQESRIYKWKNNKVTEYTIDTRNWTTWQTTSYQYTKGKVSLSRTRSEDSEYIRKYNSKGHIIESESLSPDEDGSVPVKTYTTYTYDSKGNVISETYWEILDGKKYPFAKTKYASYKKYSVPKGDKVLNNFYQDLGCSVYTLVLPKAK